MDREDQFQNCKTDFEIEDEDDEVERVVGSRPASRAMIMRQEETVQVQQQMQTQQFAPTGDKYTAGSLNTISQMSFLNVTTEENQEASIQANEMSIRQSQVYDAANETRDHHNVMNLKKVQSVPPKHSPQLRPDEVFGTLKEMEARDGISATAKPLTPTSNTNGSGPFSKSQITQSRRIDISGQEGSTKEHEAKSDNAQSNRSNIDERASKKTFDPIELVQRQRSQRVSNSSHSGNSRKDVAVVSRQKTAKDKSLDDVLAMNDAAMEKSFRSKRADGTDKNKSGGLSQNQSADNVNDISGPKLNTSLDRSGPNALHTSGFADQVPAALDNTIRPVSEVSALPVSFKPLRSPDKNQAQRDSTDTQKLEDLQAVRNQITAGALAAQINQSILLNQSLMAPNAELMALRQAKVRDSLFLEKMKLQIVLLQDRLKRELHQRMKLMEEFAKVRTNTVHVAKNMPQKSKTTDGEFDWSKLQEAVISLKVSVANMLVLSAGQQLPSKFTNASKNSGLKQEDEEQSILDKSTGEDPYLIEQTSQDKFKASRQDEKSPPPEPAAYLSPDDGLPDKQIQAAIFDQSASMKSTSDHLPRNFDPSAHIDQSYSGIQNSLYLLEHQNSIVKGLNKPLEQNYVGGAHNFRPASRLFDQSMISAFSHNNQTIMRNLHQMSIMQSQKKNRAEGYQGDPPSHSNILNDMDQEGTSQESSYIVRGDGDLSQNLLLNKSILTNSGGKRGKFDRSVFLKPEDLDKSYVGARGPAGNSDLSQILQQAEQKNHGGGVADESTFLLREGESLADLTGLDTSAMNVKADDAAQQQQEQLAAHGRSRLPLDASMQIIPEESRAENETTIDYGDSNSSRSPAQAAVGTSILPGLGLHNDITRTVDSNTSLRESEVSKLVHFFDKDPNVTQLSRAATQMRQQRVKKPSLRIDAEIIVEPEQPVGKAKGTVKTPKPEDLRKRADTMLKKPTRPLKGSAGKLPRAKTLRGTDEKVRSKNGPSSSFRNSPPTKKQAFVANEIKERLRIRKTLKLTKTIMAEDLDATKGSLSRNIGWTPMHTSTRIADGLSTAVADMETTRNNSVEEGQDDLTNNEGSSRLILNMSSLHPKFELLLQKQKSWLLERKKLRAELREQQQQNDQLAQRIKELQGQFRRGGRHPELLDLSQVTNLRRPEEIEQLHAFQAALHRGGDISQIGGDGPIRNLPQTPLDTTALSGFLAPSYLGQLPRRAAGEEEDFSVSDKQKRSSGGANYRAFENLLLQNMTSVHGDASQLLRQQASGLAPTDTNKSAFGNHHDETIMFRDKAPSTDRGRSPNSHSMSIRNQMAKGVPNDVAEMRRRLQNNIKVIEEQNQSFRAQIMQNSLLLSTSQANAMDPALEHSINNLTREVFGQDAQDLSAIPGANQLGGLGVMSALASQLLPMHDVSRRQAAGPLDESNFSVGDNDESRIINNAVAVRQKTSLEEVNQKQTILARHLSMTEHSQDSASKKSPQALNKTSPESFTPSPAAELKEGQSSLKNTVKQNRARVTDEVPILALIRNNQQSEPEDQMRMTAGFAGEKPGGLLSYFGDQVMSGKQLPPEEDGSSPRVDGFGVTADDETPLRSTQGTFAARGSIHQALPAASMQLDSAIQAAGQHLRGGHLGKQVPAKRSAVDKSVFSEDHGPHSPTDGPGFGSRQAEPSGTNPVQHTTALNKSNSSLGQRDGKTDAGARITFNPGDQDALKSQLMISKEQVKPVNVFKGNDASPGSSDQQKSSQQLSMSFPHKSGDKSQMSLDFHVIARGADDQGQLTPSLIPPKDEEGDFTPTAFSADPKEDRTPRYQEQAERSQGDRDISYISNIQRDKDASYLMLNQTVSNMSTFLPQNSFYMNASFLRPSNAPQPRGSGDSVEDDHVTPVRGGGKLFAGLNPKHTGQSKFDAAVATSANLDGSGAQVLDYEGPNRFTLGNDNMFSSALLNSAAKSKAAADEDDLSELYRQQAQQQIQQQILQQEMIHQQLLLQQAQDQYSILAGAQSAAAIQSALGANNFGMAANPFATLQHASMMTASFTGGAGHGSINNLTAEQLNSLLISQHIQRQSQLHLVQQQQRYRQELLNQYRQSLGVPTSQDTDQALDKNQMKDIFLMMTRNAPRQSQRSSLSPAVQARGENRDTLHQPTNTTPESAKRQKDPAQFFKKIASKARPSITKENT